MEAAALVCCLQNQERLQLTGFGGCSSPWAARTSSDHKGLTWQIKGGSSERQSTPNPFPRTISHPKKGHSPPSAGLRSGRMCFCGARVREGHHRCPSEVYWTGGYLGGWGGRINFSKVQRLQGLRLRERFYKYLLNRTLPVNWWQSKVWFSFPPPETAGKAGLTN